MSNTNGGHLLGLSEQFDQSPWVDNLRRSHIDGGHLQALILRGVKGLTSNPTIFQKAIQSGEGYGEQLTRLAAEGLDTNAIYWRMVLDDIRGAARIFRSVYDATDGLDGYVSVEVDPSLAHDTDATLAAARELHQTLALANVMIKIPATRAGLPAIRAMIGEGRNVNVTLIFSLERYAEVVEAYIAGLEDLVAAGGDPSSVSSVASFFISRVDTEVDRRLDEAGTSQHLKGRAAVAQAKLAYQHFVAAFAGPRWKSLSARGARVQRPLWASTSTKNPSYPDTLYVDELIGPFTVNTLPDETLEAFDDHGRLERRIDAGVDEAERVWSELDAAGIDMGEVADKLEREGVASFQKSFVDLIAVLAERVRSDGSNGRS